MTMTQADLMHVLRGAPGATARCAANEIEYLTITLAEALEAVQGEREVDIECLISRAIDPVRVAGGAEWRCEPPEVLVAATLAPESEAPVAPPQAPRVGEVWEVKSGRKFWVHAVQDGNVCLCARETDEHGVSFGHAQMSLDEWHEWVRKIGARPVSDPQPAAEPPAPEVGQVWEAPDYIARTVANIDAWHVWYRLHGYPDRVHAAKQSRWHAWVRRSGAKVVG